MSVQRLTVLYFCLSGSPGGGVGGVTSLYKPYRFVLPQRVWILDLFGQKTGKDFPILVWNRVWFSGELRECTNVFIVSIPNE